MRCRHKGAERLAAGSDCAIAARSLARAPTIPQCSCIPPAAPASRRASCCRIATCSPAFAMPIAARRSISTRSILAYLPMAWVGDFAVTMGAGIALHFTINIPERQETVLHNLREIAPTFYLAAPRSWDNLLTAIQVRMEDSSRLKKRHLRVLHGVCHFGRKAQARRRRTDLDAATARSARRVAGVRADQGPVRPDPAARRLHRRRGHGRGHVRLLPRARHQAAPALRPDRKQRLQRHPERGRGPAAHGRPSAARRRAQDQRRPAKS